MSAPCQPVVLLAPVRDVVYHLGMPIRKKYPAPEEIFHVEKGVQLCFCGKDHSALAPEPLIRHGLRCLMWDWAMAVKLITPDTRSKQIDSYLQEEN